MNQVAADCVAPAHVAPPLARGVVLVEEVILAIVEDHSIRVVHPILRGREVKLWTEWLVEAFRCRDPKHQRQEAENGHETWAIAEGPWPIMVPGSAFVARILRP